MCCIKKITIMKYNTFKQIYYAHRIRKANLLRKVYIYLTLPINFILNKISYPKIQNLDLLAEKKQFLFKKDFNYLCNFFNTDKGEFFVSQYGRSIFKNKKLNSGHNYHIFYEKFFYKKKNDKLNILELGSFKGGATASFYFYFKNSEIYSGDLFPDLFLYKSKRIKNFFINTSEENEIIQKIINVNKKFDIIIEDAGHYLKDQIISLFLLFRVLNRNGFYVIEELDFPDTRKDMNINNEKPTLRKILLNIKNNKDFHSEYILDADKKYFLDNLKNIQIFKGKFNEIAFIEKK